MNFFQYMFYFGGYANGNSSFNQDISSWDVSNGTNFKKMFYGAEVFDQNLSLWDVSNGVNFDDMFEDSQLAEIKEFQYP